MFEVGDIISWSDKIQEEQHDYIGLILEDRGQGIFKIQPLSTQFIEEVESLGDETIKLKLNGPRSAEWRKLC